MSDFKLRIRKFKGHDEEEVLEYEELNQHDLVRVGRLLIEALGLKIVRPRYGRDSEIELVRIPE